MKMEMREMKVKNAIMKMQRVGETMDRTCDSTSKHF